MRIISTVPSQTELLYDLGLEAEVVGITKFCVHPLIWFKSKQRIGGTKTLDLDLIKELNPDLIIANKEENVKEQIDALAKFTKVYVSEVKTLADNLKLIQKIGSLTNKKIEAELIYQKTQNFIKNIKKNKTRKKVIYLIWKDPYMSVGNDTFINNVLFEMGFDNVLTEVNRYPEITIKEIKELNPELIMLSSEPFPFKDKHIKEIETEITNTKVILVDGEAFSWYGTRLLKKEVYFKELQEKLLIE